MPKEDHGTLYIYLQLQTLVMQHCGNILTQTVAAAERYFSIFKH